MLARSHSPEHAAVESAQSIDSDVDSGGGELTLGDQMVEPALEICGGQLIGRAMNYVWDPPVRYRPNDRPPLDRK